MLTKHEIAVLRTMNGEGDYIGRWGAWVGACLENLRGRGYVTRGARHEITDAGKASLAKLRETT